MKTLAHPRDTLELLRRLGELREDSARRWGRMTAHQMVCHLADGFRMATGDRTVAAIANPFTRTFLKWVVLYAPLRWPRGITTCPEIDQEHGGTKRVDFAADIAQVVALLERVTQARGLARQPHPLFGRMSSADWLRWGYLHMDHHLRQFGA